MKRTLGKEDQIKLDEYSTSIREIELGLQREEKWANVPKEEAPFEAPDAERHYGVVIARVGQYGNVGIAVAALVSTPLLGLGVDLEALGWLTTATHAVSIGLVLSLPDVRWVKHSEDHDDHHGHVLEDPKAASDDVEEDAVERKCVGTCDETPELLL